MGYSSASDRHHHDVVDPHRRAPWIADLILGAQDGLVNVLGVILGVATATRSPRIVLVAGLATALAESVSMAAVAYTTSVARGELFKSERAREYRHIEQLPDLERDEVREIYRKKGFSGALLERIVETITNDKDVWVAVMMAEEHGLTDADRGVASRSAMVVGCSSLAGSLLPVIPFAVVGGAQAVWVAAILSAFILFSLGYFKAKMTVGPPMRGGLELAAIGMLAALVGFIVGALLPAS